MATMVRIHWLEDGEVDDASTFTRVLYSYSHPETREVLYIGKADYCTVQERRYGRHKEDIFQQIRAVEQIDRVFLRIGIIYLEKGRRFSSELLSDIESLLILRLQPRYNIQAIDLRR